MKDENKSKQQLIDELKDAREQLSVLKNYPPQYVIENERKEIFQIINNGPLVTFVWVNKSGWPVEFVTDNVEKLFGYTPDEFLSGRFRYEQIVHPDDLNRVIYEVTTFSGDKNCTEFTHAPYRIFTKQGEVKWVNDTTYIQRDKNGDART